MNTRLDRASLEPSLAEVERRRWLFGNLPLDPLHRDWLRQRAWVRTLHGTTRIEGNTLSGLEVERLLEGVGAKALPRKDAREILGMRAALEMADGIAADATVAVDQGVIRELHRRVLEGQNPLLTPGEYRRGENRVGGADGEIIFTTPPSGDVPELMRDLTDWMGEHASLPAPILAASVHLEFVAIHPFNDGNGRTARALGRLILVRGGYAFDGLVSLDALLDNQRRDYFAAIRDSIGNQYHQPYDATPFAAYFLAAITAAADHVLARLRGLGEVQIRVRRDVVEGHLQPAMLDALVYAFINRSLRPADYARLSGRGPASTTRDLAAASKREYLVAEGSTRNRWYRLGPRLLETPAPGEPADPRNSVPRT